MCHLQELWTKYRNKSLVILGLDTADDKKIALEMLRQNGATFPNIIDASDAAEKVNYREYRCSGVPVNYIIDGDGKIVDAWYGYEEGHPRALKALRKIGGELAEAIHQDQFDKVAKAAPEVTAAAQRLFQAIRAADYNHDWITTRDWERFPAKDVDYTVDHNYPGWVR